MCIVYNLNGIIVILLNGYLNMIVMMYVMYVRLCSFRSVVAYVVVTYVIVNEFGSIVVDVIVIFEFVVSIIINIDFISVFCVCIVLMSVVFAYAFVSFSVSWLYANVARFVFLLSVYCVVCIGV